MKPPRFMTLGDLGLLTLTLLVLSPLCSCQDDSVLHYCVTRPQPQFNASCIPAGVIMIKQAYIGDGCPPPSDNRTICVGLTERLRVNCNRLHTCATQADPLAVGCDPGAGVYIEYECVPAADEILTTLASPTSQTASGQAVWLRSKAHPPEADDVYRQMCLITVLPPQVIQVDFLDISHSEDRTSGSPYCVYGPGFSVCAQQASERRTIDVNATSDAMFTLLFWSNNYTVTPTARFWIDIRTVVNSSFVVVVCGFSLLHYPSMIITPEPYTSQVTPQGSNITFLVSVISGALGGVFLLGILATLLYVYVYKRPKKRQSSAGLTGVSEQTADDTEMSSVPTRGVDNVYMTGPGSTTVDDFAASDTYDQPNGVHTAVSRSVSVPDGFYDTPIDADMAYFDISSDDASGYPPQRSASVDPSLPVEHLYSEVMRGRVSVTGGDDVTTHLYDEIGFPCSCLPASPQSSEVPAAPDNTTDPPEYSQLNEPMKTTLKDANANGVLYQSIQHSGNGMAVHSDVGVSAHSAIPETNPARTENALHIGAGLYDKPRSNDILYDDTLPARRTGRHGYEANTRDYDSSACHVDGVSSVENDVYEPTAPPNLS